MKKTTILLCCTLALACIGFGRANAQSSSGIVVGMSYSFYNNSTLNPNNAVESIDYDNGMGFQVGYQWALTFSNHFDLNFGAIYNFIKANNKITSVDPTYLVEYKKPGMFLSTPVTVNYHIKHFYLGLGCEAGVNIARGNPNLPYDFFAFIGQLGLNLKRVDLQLKYILGVPRKFDVDNVYYGTAWDISGDNGYDSSNIGTAQLSLIIPLHKR